MSDFNIDQLKEKTEKSLNVLKEDMGTVRAGRANAALVDKVVVEYYGTPTPLKSLANISVPEPRTLLISPFDPKSIPEIEKAINVANIGINPVNDGKVIRLQIPQVTEERRKELTKVVKKMGEDSKVAVRNLRRDANDKVKKLEKAGDFTEDDAKSTLDDIQKIIDQAVKDIDTIVVEKEKEILEV
ncbi:MAG: ribosome recycling factor [Anaerovoracaceae bacterium]